MYFQEGDISTCWEQILSEERYHLMLVEIQDSYPDIKSITVDFSDIDSISTEFGAYILENPDKSIAVGKKVIKELMSGTWDPSNNINLRIDNLPLDATIEIRNLRAKHLGRLVAVEGLVRKVTSPKPRLTRALYRCVKCNAEVWEPQSGMIQREPLFCPNEGCNKSAPNFHLDERMSEYIDTQKVEIQENPEGLRGGAQPERLFGYIEDDIAGKITPGNRVTLNGIIRSVQKMERDKSTIFEIFIDVISYEFEQNDFSELNITEEDEKEILEMAKDPDILNKIIRSIAPTIYGLDKEKEAVALQLFGGSQKVMDDGTTMRGDIHILMMGDPGVAKSQLLRYMSALSPRGIYASGKSASSAGLCVHGDTILDLESGMVRIADYVDSRMTDPEEYRPGIWRQAVSGDRIESINSIGTVLMPITYVWRIATPERLIRLTTVGGDTLVLTPETKIQAMKDARFDWMEASVLAAGDFVTVMKNNGRLMMLQSVESITEGLPEYVYDLTVDPAHSFLGSGFIIHNTAAAVKDDFGDGRWTLEAGALVLADKGLACIDELDKMTDNDRSSLHEAMESQRISVAKAGITATLQCRCSMLAAANPKLGRFDMDVKIAEQINLPPALMSRFDLMFVLTDKPDAKLDRNIATHILDGHLRGQARVQKAPVDGVDIDGILEHTSNIKPPYSVDILRKYVAYAKKNYVPVMTQEAYDLIRDDYLRIRLSSKDGSIPITARQLEAYIRLAEASAKMHLRNTVTKDDARRSIELIEYYLKKIASTGDSFDIDLAGGSFSNSERKRSREIIYNEIKNAVGGISMEQLKQICANEGISGNTVETVVEMLRDNMDVVATRGLYRLLESGN